MATILYANGTTAPLQLDADGSVSLHQLREVVGGYIEVVYLDGHRDLLVLDEEGKLVGRPVNHAATALASARHRLSPGDVIVGDVVRCRVEHPGEDEERWI